MKHTEMGFRDDHQDTAVKDHVLDIHRLVALKKGESGRPREGLPDVPDNVVSPKHTVLQDQGVEERRRKHEVSSSQMRSHVHELTRLEPSRGTSTALSQSTFRRKPDDWSIASTIFWRPPRVSGEPLNVNSRR